MQAQATDVVTYCWFVQRGERSPGGIRRADVATRPTLPKAAGLCGHFSDIPSTGRSDLPNCFSQLN